MELGQVDRQWVDRQWEVQWEVRQWVVPWVVPWGDLWVVRWAVLWEDLWAVLRDMEDPLQDGTRPMPGLCQTPPTRSGGSCEGENQASHGAEEIQVALGSNM
jgi:hypothetical protein